MAGFLPLLSAVSRLFLDFAGLLRRFLQPKASLAAENLFLRKQLAFYQERKVRPRRADGTTKLVLVLLSRCFDWKEALVVVRPETLIRWHRTGVSYLLEMVGKTRPAAPSPEPAGADPIHGA